MRFSITVRRGLIGFALTAFLFAWLVNWEAKVRNSQPDTARNIFAQVETWQHLSSVNGDIDTPTANPEPDQTYTLVLDIDHDGLNDFVIGTRRGTGPSMVWYQRHETGWTRHIIENSVFGIEAGGDFYDIDGDGDLDIVAGGDFNSNQIWWWENPYPDFEPDTPWTRRLIKNDGAKTHHDMVFGDFDGDSSVELAYWNQGVNTLSIVDIPSDPKNTQPWPGAVAIYTAPSDRNPEGIAQADIDLDGKTDIIGGGYWFKHNGVDNFTANLIEYIPYMRVAVGQLIPGGRPEIVQIPGDASGTGKWYEWNGSTWVSHVLPVGTVIHGHSLELGDVDQDGNLDIFIGEMRQTVRNNDTLNPTARALMLYGDGQGGFTIEQISSGIEHHESRLADLDGDGDLDILGKPFIWNVPRLDIWLNLVDEPSEPPATETGTPETTPTDTPPSPSCFSLNNWTTHVIDSARPHRAVFIDSADLDGDGYQDIVTGAWWYRNPGAAGGAWQRFDIGAPLNQMVVIHDFDNDGFPDILGTVQSTTNSQPHMGNVLVWARNNGSGEFTIHDNIPAGSGTFPQGAVAGIFQGGARQVFISWHNEAVGIDRLTIPADPMNQQWSKDHLASLSLGEELSVGDIDRDDDPDLLLGTVWLQNLGSTWSNHTLFDGVDADRNRLADIDNDGRLDAVIGYETVNAPGKLAWYQAPANPVGLWTENVLDMPIAPMSLDVADADGDGDLDIVVGEHNQTNPQNGRVFIYENNGGEFVRHTVATGHEHHDGTQFVDVNNDGGLDIISIGWHHGNVLLYEQQSGCEPGTATVPAPTNTPVAPTNTPPAGTTPTATATAAPIQCPVTVPGNLVGDPGFQLPFQANKNANWTFYSNASAAASTTTQNPYQCAPAAQIAVTTPGNNVQLYQSGIALQPNTTYQFSIAARASANRAVQVALAKHTSPFTNYGLNSTINLTPNWQVFTITFTTKGFSSDVGDGRLRIAMENSDVAGDFFYFDDVIIAPPGSVPPTPTPIPPGTATSTPTAAPCVPGVVRPIGEWDWNRHLIDGNRPGRANFMFTFDVDNDGRADILTGKYWYRNPDTISGAWTRTQRPAPIEDVAAMYDFDGDGDLDIFASAGATLPFNQGYWQPFVWARNEGGGTFTVFNNIDNTNLTMPPNDPMQGVAIARYSPGGPLEIAITWDDTEPPATNPHGIQMFTVPADPTTGTWARRKLSDFSHGEQLTAVDLDNDGDQDLFLGMAWLRNDYPANAWTLFTILDPGSQQIDRHKVIDVNGDGKLDVITGYSHDPILHRLMWYEQPASPEQMWIAHPIANLPLGDAASLDVIDIDGDGDSDIVVGEYRYTGTQEYPANLFIFENGGLGVAWTQHTVYYGDSHYQSTQAVDMDGDGDLDIVSKGWYHGRVHLYENLNGNCAAVATATPSPVPGTSTHTPIPTSTQTSTATPTASGTPMITPAPTETDVPATTPTATSTATAAPTNTPALTATVVTQCPIAVPGNLVGDPGFQLPFQANKNASWTFYSNASAAASTTTQNPYQCAPAAQIAVTTPGNNVQLYQSGIALQPNTTYQFSIAARASANRAVQVALAKHTSPFTNYGLNSTINLTPNWQVFTITFTTKGFSSAVSDGRLRIAMENSDAAGDFFYFDDVVIAPPGSVPPTPTNTPVSGNTATHTPVPTSTHTPAAPTGVATITVWYGQTQTFGTRNGMRSDPIPWVNILGNVSKPAGYTITSLSYTLNGGPPVSLRMGPDNRRLADPGDFNVEIDRTILQPGDNQVVITAVDNMGGVRTFPVTVVYSSSGNTWTPGTYTFDWNTAAKVTDLAQPVDGQWALVDGGVTATVLDYDRLLAIGDESWRDYTVTVPITIYGIDPSGYAYPSNGPGVGVIVRWAGHYDDGNAISPVEGWRRLGALAWYHLGTNAPGDETLQMYRFGGLPGQIVKTGPRVLDLNTTYNFKIRVQSAGDESSPATYQFKVWNASSAEPGGWDLTTPGIISEPANGSLLLVAHHVNARFGMAQVELASTTQSSPPTLTPTPVPTNTPEGQAYQVTLAADAGAFARTDKPAEMSINFTQLLAAEGQTGAFDPNSLLVVEVNSGGNIIDSEVPFQFDMTANYNAASNAAGTLVWLMEGVTPANTTRRYRVYYDVTGKGFTPSSFTPLVTATDNVPHKGYQSIRLVTANGEYYYHKTGGGFATLLDANNNDWIGWNSSTTPSGAAGDFRGIPNMVHPTDGGYFHPGRNTATTALVSQGPLKITFRSTADNGQWETIWEVYPTYARMTVAEAPAVNYWFLYEGTPGGLLEPGIDTQTRSNGAISLLSATVGVDIPGDEWLYFSDPNVGRSLFLAHHQSDILIDGYFPMDGLMTVFGFGRNNNARLLSGAGRQFTIGLANATAYNTVGPIIYNAYTAVAVTVEGSGAPTSTPAPTATVAPGQCLPTTGNLVANPGFANTANWIFYTDGKGTFTTTTANPYQQCALAAQIAIQTAGSNVQLYQSGIVLQPNTTYQFSIAARASANRAVQVALAKHTSPFTNYGLNSTINLTPNWQVFTITFTTKGFTSAVSDGRLRIAMENSDAAGDFFYFDNVVIVPSG